MGCASGRPLNTKGSKDLTPAIRRRLSLGDLGESDATLDRNSAPTETQASQEEDRSLLLQLSRLQVLAMAKRRTEKSTTNGSPAQDPGVEEGVVTRRRSFTLGSETDQEMHRVDSFKMKTIKSHGEAMQVKDGMGYACKKGKKPESPNQDSFFILKVDGVCSIYGVFDGHGRRGHDISNFIKENLPKILLQNPVLEEDPPTALSETFAKTQSLLVEATRMKMIDATQSGSTVSVIYHDHLKNILHVAHVGDSRCVLGKFDSAAAPKENAWRAKDLTVDHKPNDPEERRRIEAAGGRVVFDGGWNYRVYAKHHRGPGLNMSRAMGDLKGYWYAGISPSPDVASVRVQGAPRSFAAGRGPAAEEPPPVPKEVDPPAGENPDRSGAGMEKSSSLNSDAMNKQVSNALSSQASISSISIGPSDKFVLLCSDGVWEFISSDEAVRIVSTFEPKDAMKAAEHLSGIAWDRWNKEMQGQVVDDITALVINLQGVQRE